MKLLDCPFCGGAPQIHTQMSSRYQFVSCSRCRCDGPLKERARDAISHWNRRASPTPPTTEGRLREVLEPLVKAWDDYQKKASSARSEGQADAYYMLAKYLRADWEKAKAALLSSPRVEEVGREERERIIKIVEKYWTQNISTQYDMGSSDTAAFILETIRSLSLPDGEGKEKLARSPSALSAPASTGKEGHDQ